MESCLLTVQIVQIVCISRLTGSLASFRWSICYLQGGRKLCTRKLLRRLWHCHCCCRSRQESIPPPVRTVRHCSSLEDSPTGCTWHWPRRPNRQIGRKRPKVGTFLIAFPSAHCPGRLLWMPNWGTITREEFTRRSLSIRALITSNLVLPPS